MSILDRQFIIHVASEVIVIACLGYYFSKRDKITNGRISKLLEQNNSYETKITQLENKIGELEGNISRLEAFLYNFTQANMLQTPRPVMQQMQPQPQVRSVVNNILENRPLTPTSSVQEEESITERHSPIPEPTTLVEIETIDYDTLDKELENELAELQQQ